MRGRWTASLLCVALIAPAAGATSAAAHSVPQRFTPAIGATVQSAPGEVRILFDGDVEPAFSTIQVTDGAGRRVDRGETRVDERNRRLVRVKLGPLEPGVYQVTWQILANDGHRGEGTYTFPFTRTVGGR